MLNVKEEFFKETHLSPEEFQMAKTLQAFFRNKLLFLENKEHVLEQQGAVFLYSLKKDDFAEDRREEITEKLHWIEAEVLATRRRMLNCRILETIFATYSFMTNFERMKEREDPESSCNMEELAKVKTDLYQHLLNYLEEDIGLLEEKLEFLEREMESAYDEEAKSFRLAYLTEVREEKEALARIRNYLIENPKLFLEKLELGWKYLYQERFFKV